MYNSSVAYLERRAIKLKEQLAVFEAKIQRATDKSTKDQLIDQKADCEARLKSIEQQLNNEKEERQAQSVDFLSVTPTVSSPQTKAIFDEDSWEEEKEKDQDRESYRNAFGVIDIISDILK